jgi:uncharacterized protein (TIGR02246 family)
MLRIQEGEMIRSLWIPIVCIALMSCATAPAGTEQAKAAVQQASDQFWATRLRGDAPSFAAQFTDAGMFMVPGLADATGRAAIQELAQLRFAGGKISDFKIDRREIEVSGDSAHEVAWYSETLRGQDQAMRMMGRYLLVWNRGADGVWRVHRYLYNFSDAEPIP